MRYGMLILTDRLIPNPCVQKSLCSSPLVTPQVDSPSMLKYEFPYSWFATYSQLPTFCLITSNNSVAYECEIVIPYSTAQMDIW